MLSTTHRWILFIGNVTAAAVAVCVWRSGLEDGRLLAMSFVQATILGNTLVVVWLYTRGTFRLATSAEAQVSFMKEQFYDQKVQELIDAKATVFTNRQADGTTHISNLGEAYAVNVWYLSDTEKDPIPLGSLGQGQSQRVDIPLADRHVLIGEARQMPAGPRSRKFTATLNAWNGRAFAHGFVRITDKSALAHGGSVSDYLKKVPHLIPSVLGYDPLNYDPSG